MKKNLLLTSALLFVGAAGMSMAQTRPMTPGTSVPMKGTGKGAHPKITAIRARLEEQNERIQAGVKDKKMTQDEGRALHGKVKAVRVEMINDIKSNGVEDLTDDQFERLNQELDVNSRSIHDEKAAGASTPAAP
jgi:hypothetical protein